MTSSFSELTLCTIIQVYNGDENFRKCLSSLSKAVPLSKEIIVVVDGDTDGPWHLAEGFSAQVLKTPIHRGPACARNLRVSMARGGLLFFVDADVAGVYDHI